MLISILCVLGWIIFGIIGLWWLWLVGRILVHFADFKLFRKKYMFDYLTAVELSLPWCFHFKPPVIIWLGIAFVYPFMRISGTIGGVCYAIIFLISLVVLDMELKGCHHEKTC